ncbi:hypothetical protein OS175_00615 [Marinicella sp. S1101]|uniref:hypothetical protein n=1 Tax=Marinicella marina TaxID=2996016 RepID=UPI002260F880|nr:hypothetical protein [Marinicella marina]MCX7552364.1 hypothetical protein [Marinicella marina]MDJ1139239.1 hypothetical protein [Marinicella marina]
MSDNKHSTLLKTAAALTLGLLYVSNNVMAHQDASDPTFCSEGSLIEIGTVNITGNAMEGMLKDKPVDCPIGIKDVKQLSGNDKELKIYVGGVLVNRNPVKRHDFFDNTPARLAYAYASCVCASMSNQDYSPSEVRPLILGPAVLLDENHHVDYDLSEGLEFSCQVCKTRQ